MGFQLVASRLLAPHFGSSIIVWAFLISSFLLSFSLGSFFGGFVSRLSTDKRRVCIWAIVIAASLGFFVTAFGGKPILNHIELLFDLKVGLFLSCFSLFFVPITMLSSLSPLITDVVASSTDNVAGYASGIIYGTSTVGNIAGVMGTAFLLVPNYRISQLLLFWFFFSIVILVITAKTMLSLTQIWPSAVKRQR